MSLRYFTKLYPKQALFLASSGREIEFHEMAGLGYLRSDDPQLARNPNAMQDFDDMMAAGRGGLNEISAEQYDEQFVKKKASSPSLQRSSPRMREELRPGVLGDTLSPAATPNTGAAAAPEQSAPKRVTSLRDIASLGNR